MNGHQQADLFGVYVVIFVASWAVVLGLRLIWGSIRPSGRFAKIPSRSRFGWVRTPRGLRWTGIALVAIFGFIVVVNLIVVLLYRESS